MAKKKKAEEYPELVTNSDQLSMEVVRYDLTNVDIESLIRILYGVKTKRLNEQVKRNIKRFPDDLCFNSPKVNGILCGRKL